MVYRMEIKKIIVLLILMSMTCGCQATYQWKVNEDLSSKDSLTALESMDYFKSRRITKEKVIEEMLEKNYDYLSDLNYKYDYYQPEEEDLYGIKITANYDNLKDYFSNSPYFNQYWEKVEYKTNDSIVTIKTTNYLGYREQDPNRFAIDNTKIIISVPYEIINSNASNCEMVNNYNRCSWIITKDSTQANVNISFDVKDKNLLKEKENPQKKIIKKASNQNGIFIFGFILGGVLGLLLLIILIIGLKSKKNSELK